MACFKKKLFLASSSELKEDRKEFEIFISRKNKDWAGQGVYLELVLWEDFLDAVSQTRLQDEYNKAIKECDLFVMLFFTKVGKYTAEEFETAFGQFKATNQPFILTYFKDADISTGNLNLDDLISLKSFQEKLNDLGHFYTRYQNIDALKLHFSQQLDKLAATGFIERKQGLDETDPPGGEALGERAVKVGGDNAGIIISGTQIINHYHGASEGQGKAEIARQVAGYLLWLRERTGSIELRGIEKAGGAPVVLLPLATAYVPLRAKSMPRWGDEPSSGARLTRNKRKPSDDVQSKESDNDIALNEVLGLGNRLVIIGGPGCGKTTVMLHMAWALAASLLAGQNEPARSRLGLDLPPDALPLPILVPLASFARYRRNLAHNTPAREKTLSFFLSHHLISKEADFDLPADFFVKLLTDGRNVMLLLDGLDEVANEDERAEVRQSVEELVGGREALRVVVTCRTIAYRSGRTALGASFREISVLPLDRELHIVPMVSHAYACIHPHDTALRLERIADLLNGIDRLEAERRVRLGEDAVAFVDSPLMVRL